MTLVLTIFLNFLAGKKLDCQREVQKAVMVYKSLNGLAPDYLCPKFVDRSGLSTYLLRDSEGKLSVLLPRTEFRKTSGALE